MTAQELQSGKPAESKAVSSADYRATWLILGELLAACAHRYQHQADVSAGGMGAVQKVTDKPLTRSVARKTLLPNLVGDPKFTDLFLREARITAQLEHPHVVPVHDLGVNEFGPFFTMKLIEGHTLQEWIESRKSFESLPWNDLLDMIDIVIKVCDALAFAHGKGVLHRDIKPANVMIGSHGQVYLMDWGIALRIEEQKDPPPVAPGDEPRDIIVVGTPAYMAPEQANCERLDTRADIFSVGALVYNALSGAAPYGASSLPSVVSQAIVAEPSPLLELRPELPPALCSIVAKAMSAKREDRFQSVDELRAELVRFLRGGQPFDAVTHEAGECIVREGETGGEAFIVERGRCVVTIKGERIRELGPGEVFGEMAILAASARTASVHALEQTVLRRIDGATLLSELDSMKPWMGSLIRTLAARFAERG
jgi:serine/threonine-protein kinase